MTPEAQRALQTFVASQKTAHGYMNAGGHEDAYYQQFGEVLEAVFTPRKLLTTNIRLTVQESRHKDTVYGRFFDFLNDEMTLGKRSKGQGAWSKGQGAWSKGQEVRTTNAVCCVLAMQHQMGLQSDATDVEWLQKRQDETGGFYASEQAPIPDLLSTAVALFTLRLLEINVKDATPFIQAHGLDNGGFAPTLYDDYSDVEYVFYGLLALGSI
ncbi:MAG: hypothetical protein J6T11_05100 [Bacteroidaceae bacterium]|nr:hypothetical protein [Bacteroidaceae bacterium]